ncbi:hypothetical protein D922_02979 [Enterococcus faecalis 06-MB-DW-09]|nr:hypothetical protein D922_02979 [Enterococcus faecalis 06-MB-DW-09]
MSKISNKQLLFASFLRFNHFGLCYFYQTCYYYSTLLFSQNFGVGCIQKKYNTQFF